MTTHHAWQWPVVILIAAANVAMNALLKKAAGAPDLARSIWLWGALLAGTASVVLLLLLYRSGVLFAPTMITLGATSVLLGVGWGLLRGEHLRPIETTLLLILLCFYAAAWMVRR